MAGEKAPQKYHGFIIYRGDYSDDAQWERFMAYLKHQTHRGLEKEGKLQLYSLIDWKVMVKSLNTFHVAHCWMG